MNTGGPAFPGTLLDWMAGQALVGLLAYPAGSGFAEGYAESAYDYAAAMLAEKARREADHSGDANKMATDPFAEDTLRRLAADVLPPGIKEASNESSMMWCADQVRERVNTLEAQNRELVEALEWMVCASEDVQSKGYAFARLDAGVVVARTALAKAKETKP